MFIFPPWLIKPTKNNSAISVFPQNCLLGVCVRSQQIEGHLSDFFYPPPSLPLLLVPCLLMAGGSKAALLYCKASKCPP